MDSAIEVRSLVKTYPGNVTALAGIGFSVGTGSLFALLGADGAGKSTMIKVLATTTPADSGHVWIAGHDVRRRPEQTRRVVGVVGATRPTGATGRATLAARARRHGLRGPALQERVDELLTGFGLWDARDQAVRRYSGGMRRRLDIAASLVHRPSVLLLDEPTAGLDGESREQILDGIARLRDEEPITLLLATRHQDIADRLAHHVAIIDGGRIVAQGTADELKSGLRGDTVHIEFTDEPRDGEVRLALGEIGALGEAVLTSRTLHARVEDGPSTVPAVLSALEDRGLRVTTVRVARPSLDDVHLRYTGRPLSLR